VHTGDVGGDRRPTLPGIVDRKKELIINGGETCRRPKIEGELKQGSPLTFSPSASASACLYNVRPDHLY